MRLFVALDIEDSIRDRIAHFIGDVRGFAPEARWVKAKSLHITLKFIGEKSPSAMNDIKRALDEVRTESFTLTIRGCGFFPNAGAPGIFWIGVQTPGQTEAQNGPQRNGKLAALASAIEGALLPLHIPKEEHAYMPHLTMARAKTSRLRPKQKRAGSTTAGLRQLRQKLETLPVPEFGSMIAREFSLYQSKTDPDGSVYTKLHRFDLR